MNSINPAGGTIRAARVLSLAIFLSTFAAGAWSATPSPAPRGNAEEKKEEEKPKDGEKKKEKEKKKPEILAVVGADIYTVSHEVVRNGTVLAKDGKIWKIGQNLSVPEDAKVIEAKGKIVTPGFVAINVSRVGVSGSTSGSNRFADALDPFDRNIEFCLGSGITTICARASSGFGFRSGRRGGSSRDSGSPDPIKHAAIKLAFGDLEEMHLADDLFYYVSSSTVTGRLNRFNFREGIKQARKHIADLEQYEKDRESNPQAKPPRSPVSAEMVKLAKGEIAMRTSAGTAARIRQLLSLARETDVRLVIEGAHEAWLLADEIGRAGASVIVTPRRKIAPDPGDEDASGSSIQTAGILERAGVNVVVSALSSSVSMGGLAGRDLLSLAQEAAFAVRGGFSERAALEALTLAPARMMGLADRIGSLEPGKDADMLILDGDPLDYRTYVETAIINGKVYYERDKNRVLPVFERES